MNPTSNSVLIAGIGNIFLGDDAFGSEVARRLTQQSWPDGVRVVDFGLRGIDLAYALMDGYALTILIDATPRGGEPGTLYLIEPETESGQPGAEGGLPAVQTHGMDPVKVLALAGSMGGELPRILLVGCEPAPLESEEVMLDGLSPPVARAVDYAIKMIQSIVNDFTCGKAIGSDRRIAGQLMEVVK